MSVLIKGIGMPTGNDELRLIIRSNGQVIISHKTYFDETEAILVPPHGRLIDADALWDKGWFLTRDNIYKGQIEAAIITSAPAILEAEWDE